MKILGLDPGLGTTGWGLVEADGNRLRHLANGQVKTDAKEALPQRLSHLALQIDAQARGALLAVCAQGGIEVGEYAARLVKKSVVGVGNAEKRQVHDMVKVLMPGIKIAGSDAADALAVAITHAHHTASRARGL